jgi:hypothetical protein
MLQGEINAYIRIISIRNLKEYNSLRDAGVDKKGKGIPVTGRGGP